MTRFLSSPLSDRGQGVGNQTGKCKVFFHKILNELTNHNLSFLHEKLTFHYQETGAISFFQRRRFS